MWSRAILIMRISMRLEKWLWPTMLGLFRAAHGYCQVLKWANKLQCIMMLLTAFCLALKMLGDFCCNDERFYFDFYVYLVGYLFFEFYPILSHGFMSGWEDHTWFVRKKVFPSASHGTVQGMAITCTKPREESLSKHKAYLPSDITWKPPTVNRGG